VPQFFFSQTVFGSYTLPFQTQQLNKDDAVECNKWTKLIENIG